MPGHNGRSVLLMALLLTTAAAGFFIPTSGNPWAFSFLKAGLFVCVAAIGLYALFKSRFPWESRPVEAPARSEETRTGAGPSESGSGRSWEGFGRAFGSFYRKYLKMVRISMAASSIALFFRKDGILKLEYGEDAGGTIEPHLVSSDAGLLAQVMANKTPYLQNHLSSGFSMSGRPGTEVRSFLGAPLCARDDVVGVLAIGSEAPDDFGEADLAMAAQVADLITEVMFAYRQGLEEEIEGKVFKVHLDFIRRLKSSEGEDELVTHFTQCLMRLFRFDRFTLNLRVEKSEEGVIQFVQGQMDGLAPGIRFPLDEGLSGWVLKRNTPLIISDIGEGDYLRPRYFKGENNKHGLRSFIGIPLGDAGGAWGCFSLESRRPGQYGEKARDVLINFATQFELAFQRMRCGRQIQSIRQTDNPSGSVRFELE
ncbi:GAF domain-containing protein [bacterium]|nr:GAF domain-containing protein [bacterium]